MISPKTYFLNADRTEAVPEGDKTAQFLLVRAGQEIPDVLWEKYGLNIGTNEDHPEKKADKKHK